jgi:hypothetical protein
MQQDDSDAPEHHYRWRDRIPAAREHRHVEHREHILAKSNAPLSPPIG